MSGGSFDYVYENIKETYSGKMEDIELNELIDDLCLLLKDLEWYRSGDSYLEDYKASVIEFKRKWFNRSKNKNEYKRIIDKRCKETADELKDMIQYLYEDVL